MIETRRDTQGGVARAATLLALAALLTLALFPAGAAAMHGPPDDPPGPPPHAGETGPPAWVPGPPPWAGQHGPPDFDPDEDGSISGTVTEPLPDAPDGTPFTMYVESGSLVFGQSADVPYETEFTPCPSGVPAEGDECIELSGILDEDGDVTIQPEDVSFPEVVTQSDSPIGVVDVRAKVGASDVITGTIDPDTGAVDLNMPMEIIIDALDDGADDCRVPFVLDASSATGDGSAFDGERFTAVDDAFSVPEAEHVEGGLGALACDSVNAELNLPSSSGENLAVFDMFVDQELETPEATPIAGATVEANGYSATTDENGDYLIEDVEPGTYDVSASAEGYEPATETDVEVQAGENTVVDFQLEPVEMEPTGPDLQMDITGDETVEDGEYANYTVHTVNEGDEGIDEDVNVVPEVTDAGGSPVEDALIEWHWPGVGWFPGNDGLTVGAGGIGPDYENNGEWRVLYPGEGEYTFTQSFVGADSGEVYATDSITTTVTPMEVSTFDLTVGSSEGGSVADPGEATFTYDEGTVVDLVAVADEGYEFAGWTGDVGDIADAAAASTTITMNADASITATFEEEPLFSAGAFTMYVESGSVVIGTDAAEPYVIDFTECPDGDPVEVGAECIVFEGTIDADGNFEILPEDVFFPVLEDDSGLAPITATTGISAPLTGSIDPDTGAATFDMPMQVDIDINQTGENDCRLVVDLNGTTGASGSLEGAPLLDGRLTVVDGLYSVPATTSLSTTGDSLCGIVDGTLGVPSDSGSNEAVFDLLLTQTDS